MLRGLNSVRSEMDMLNVKLVVIGGAPEGDEFLPQLPCVLGRSKAASIPLPHPLISRKHCELFENDGQLRVRDLGSTNGTFVGSQRIEECEIQDGELLTIGTVTFRALYSDHLSQHVETGQVSQVCDSETKTLTRIDTGVVGTPPSGPKSNTSNPRKRQRAK